MTYTKFYCDSLISYKNLKQIDILFIYTIIYFCVTMYLYINHLEYLYKYSSAYIKNIYIVNVLSLSYTLYIYINRGFYYYFILYFFIHFYLKNRLKKHYLLLKSFLIQMVNHR